MELDDYCEEKDADLSGEPVFDEGAVNDVVLEGNVGTILVVRRSCLTPKVAEEDDWLRSNIFQSTCTIFGKVYHFAIDEGSCENIISKIGRAHV